MTLFRCFGTGDALYERYHDEEWGVAVTDERGLYERICLELSQSGLSWITILRKRENFRAAFASFDPEVVAQFDGGDIERLMGDAGIVRNRAKIEAIINNAQVTIALRYSGQTLPELVWSFQPPPRPASTEPHHVQASTPESVALAKALKKVGFRFFGPTTAYAAMQACGLVNDHQPTCHRGAS